jgi:hypothetical protein
VLVVSDHPEAKGLVLELADQIPGCRGVDAGPLRLARQLEGFTAVIVGINRRHKIHAGLRISRLGDERRRRLNAELRAAGGTGGLKERSAGGVRGTPEGCPGESSPLGASPPRSRDREEGP